MIMSGGIMNITFPKYYDNFECIGGKCPDNCCIGWEIDVDNKTVSKYKTGKLPIFKEAVSGIVCEDGVYHFSLDRNERCPMLTDDGWCKIITHAGEDSLCRICKEHPRFYNTNYNIKEGGVGACCHSAALLILTSASDSYDLPKEKILSLNKVFSQRQNIFDIIKGADTVCSSFFGILSSDFFSTNDFYTEKSDKKGVFCFVKNALKNIEVMDRLFLSYADFGIRKAEENTGEFLKFLDSFFTLYGKNILMYFIYRYYIRFYTDFCEYAGISIAFFSVLAIALMLHGQGSLSLENAALCFRTFSKNIEYSTENVDYLSEFFDTEYNISAFFEHIKKLVF